MLIYVGQFDVCLCAFAHGIWPATRLCFYENRRANNCFWACSVHINSLTDDGQVGGDESVHPVSKSLLTHAMHHHLSRCLRC